MKQKTLRFEPDLIHHIGQLMTRFQLDEPHILMFLSEAGRVLNRHDRILGSMKNEGRLTKIGKCRVTRRVFYQFIPNAHVALLSIMKDRDRGIFSPYAQPLGTKFVNPKLVETKSRREQHEPVYFGMGCRIERAQIAAQTRTNDDDGLSLSRILDQLELTGDRQTLKLAAGEVWDLDRNAERAEPRSKETRLARTWTRCKAMEIEDTQLGRQHLHFSGLTPILNRRTAVNGWEVKVRADG